MACVMTNGFAAENFAVPAARRHASRAVRKNWFTRFLEAAVEARMRVAEREFARRRHMLADDAGKDGFAST